MSSLGKRGRIGNSLFQYAFLRGYAMAIGAEVRTPPWWGRAVFPVAAEDPMIDRVLPQTICDSMCHHKGLPMNYFFGATDVDLTGYYQSQVFLDMYSKALVREWFRLKPEFESFAPDKKIDGPYSAMHLRRGDYTRPPFNALYCTVSDESYDQAIKTFNIPSPVLRVFEGCRPAVMDLEATGLGWLVDWLLLRDADHLLRANSSFSWWAGTLGHGKVYAPVVEKRVGLHTVDFVESNSPNLAGIFHNQSDMFLKE